MAKKAQLRATRAGTVINTTSQKQESDVIRALTVVKEPFKTGVIIGELGFKV